jgi:hypothetical protein
MGNNMRCRLSLVLAGILALGAPGHVLAQVVTQKGGGGLAGTAFGGTVKGTTKTEVPLLTGQGRLGAGTGGTGRGAGNATGGITGFPRAGTGGVLDGTTFGIATGGLQASGRGLQAGTGGVQDQAGAHNGRSTGGIVGSLTGLFALGAGTGGIADQDSLGANTGGLGEETAPRFQAQ